MPCIERPETLPSYVIVTWPETAPKLIVLPVTVPVTRPAVMHGVPPTTIVPDRWLPVWANVTVNVPLELSGDVSCQDPFQGPARPADDGGFVVGDGATDGAAETAGAAGVAGAAVAPATAPAAVADGAAADGAAGVMEGGAVDVDELHAPTNRASAATDAA